GTRPRSRHARERRARRTMLTHGAGLYGDLTAAENLEFTQRMMGERTNAAAIADALARVGLAHAADQRLRTFSSGMQRRASIARLFLSRTPLLLLDEPYNSLDPDGRLLVDELLRDVQARRGSALVVLHDLDQSGVDFDTTVEMASGRISRVTCAGDRGPRLVVAGVGT
ncbi:MAG TPA: ATP-binding cassette domain-containing protein, partial [Gemmatimonadaceae bacterium]